MARIKYEQETIIRFNEEDEDAQVWSAAPRWHRKLEALGIAPDRISKGREGMEDSEESRSYHFPQRHIKIQIRKSLSTEEIARLRAQGFGRRQQIGTRNGGVS